MRTILLFVALLGISAYANAQNASASASQTIQLVLNPAIDLRFTTTNSGTGNAVSLAFNNINQYSSGIMSGTQELEVRSNKSFKISVQTDATNFAYAGTQAPANAMPVTNTLFMAVTGNTTGGSLASSFNGSYHTLSAVSQDLVLNGMQGEDKKVVLAYKAKPDMGYPAGTYSVGVIYTATQP